MVGVMARLENFHIPFLYYDCLSFQRCRLESDTFSVDVTVDDDR
jgi:hypothetical protein